MATAGSLGWVEPASVYGCGDPAAKPADAFPMPASTRGAVLKVAWYATTALPAPLTARGGAPTNPPCGSETRAPAEKLVSDAARCDWKIVGAPDDATAFHTRIAL